MAQETEPQKWKNFLQSLHYALSNNLIQKQVQYWTEQIDRLIQLTQSDSNQPDEVSKTLEEFLDLFSGNFSHLPKLKYQYVRSVNLDDGKLNELNGLLKALLKTETSFEVIKSKTLRVKGQIVTVSSVNDHFRSHPEYDAVEIFALNKVVIDADFDSSGREIQLSILAPKWDVVSTHSLKLNGKDASDIVQNAGSLDPPGSPGNHGKQGNTGGDGGSFLGIGYVCDSCRYLKIQSKGGKGGQGQDGGNGKNGKDGKRDAPVQPSYQAASDCEVWIQQWRDGGYSPQCSVSQSNWGLKWDCKVSGGAKPGGRGGNGGPGGMGGKGGTINLIVKSGANAMTVNEKGDVGLPGKAGKGGEGAKDQVLTLDLTRFSSGSSIISGSYCDRGAGVNREEIPLPEGESGSPGVKVEDDNSASAKTRYAYNPALIINDYKNYIRDNLKIPLVGTSLESFLSYIESDEKIISLYDTLGLVKDLLSLENQSQDLRKKGIPLVPFYQQFLSRVDKYKLQSYETQDAEEYGVVLSYLYRSALSKIHSINSNASNDLVVDVRKNLQYVSGNIEEWKNFKNIVEKNKSRNKYNEGIQRKIDEAVNFIKNDITADIDMNIEKSTEQLNKLYAKVVELEETAKKEEASLLKQREDLQNQMMLRAVLGIVQISSQALTFAGPVGAAAGAAIGGVTSVVDSLTTSTTPITAVSALPTAVSSTLTKLNDAYKQKQDLFKKQLGKANAQMEAFLNGEAVKQDSSEAKQKVLRIQEEMNQAKNKLSELMKSASIENPESVDEMYELRKKIDGLLRDGKEQIDKVGGADKFKKALEKTQNIIGLAKMGVELLGKVQGDLSKMWAVDESIKSVNNKLQKLDQFEESIYKTMAPLIARIHDSVDKVVESDDKSHAALDVTKWQVQNTIRDIRKQLQDMTKGFDAGTEITYYIDKVEYGMSMVIQMYDRIQSYMDQSDLVDVIADIDSSADISNTELFTAVNELKLKVSSNIIAEYESSMKAVLLYVFPFATDYMKPLTLPERFSLNGTDQLVDNLKSLEKTLLREQSTVQLRDSHVISNVTYAEGKHHVPFYVWKYNDNRNVARDLFSGNSVELKADISGSGVKENAVKFNDINVRFKTGNKALEKALQKYSVMMTHLGDSHYKCENRIYIVSHEKQVIQRSVDKEVGDANNVFAKINVNEPVLSPFASWVVSLKSDNNDFSSLSGFINEPVDLVLEGHGSYVQRGEAACTEELKKYYTEEATQGRGLLEGDEDFGDYELENLTYETVHSNTINPVAVFGNGGSLTGTPPSTGLLQKAEHAKFDGNNGIIHTPASLAASLPLLELVMHKINNSKRHERSVRAGQVTKDDNFAQSLAYRAYAPK